MSFIFSLIVGYIVAKLGYKLFSSLYTRNGIESICDIKFGDTNIFEALTEDIVIVSYDYAAHEPRLFSKYNAE